MKYILFGSGEGTQFIDNSKYSYLLNKDDKNCIWITRSYQLANKLRNQGYRAYLSYSIFGIFFQIFSQLAVVSHGTFDLIPLFLLKVPVLQYWHGCPIKKIGIDVEIREEKLVGNKIWDYIYKIYPHLNNYYCNYFVDNSKKIYYKNSFKFGKPEFIQISYPRLIPLLSNESDKLKETNTQLEELKSFKNQGKKIIVYMPTYRSIPVINNLFQDELLNLAKLFIEDDRIVFVYKPHFTLLNQTINRLANLIEYSDPDPYPLLALSAGLITDYSSIVFDYLPTNKPLSLFMFDRESYQHNPGYYFDINEKFGSLVTNDSSDVYQRITDELFNDYNHGIDRKTIFNDLFYKSFYKNGPFDIISIKKLLKNSHG